MPLILLRHTRPAVAPGLCYGRSEIDLADDFEPALAAILRDLPPLAQVTTSPLGRCRRLAERIAAARGLPLAEDPRLAEIDFGAWEGRPWRDLPRPELDAWAADFHHARPHGGETIAELAVRVAAALAELDADGPAVLWVSHAGVARAACAALDLPPGWDTRLAFGAWLELAPPRRR